MEYYLLSNENTCLYCDKKLIATMRSHARFCSTAHRCAHWRQQQLPPISVKLSITHAQFAVLTAEAESFGMLLNTLIHHKATQPPMLTLPA